MVRHRRRRERRHNGNFLAEALETRFLLTAAPLATRTQLLTDIDTVGSGIPSSPLPVTSLTNVNGTLYFAANDLDHGIELWKSDGTPGGTVMVKDINPGTAGSGIIDITAVGNKAYFFANDGTHGDQVWVSDGTPGGTVQLTNISFASSKGEADV